MGVFISPAWSACHSRLIDTRWERRFNECTRPSEDVGHALIPLGRSHSHRGNNAADVDTVTASPETGLVGRGMHPTRLENCGSAYSVKSPLRYLRVDLVKFKQIAVQSYRLYRQRANNEGFYPNMIIPRQKAVR